MDKKSYLDRLELSGFSEVSVETLALLQHRHLIMVPFENLDIHRGVEIALDVDRILEKIVTHRRGGFCYELNSAFAWLLAECGFEVSLLAAEVAHEDGGFGIPFDHLCLRVDLDRSYLVDVGFGQGFDRPLELDSRCDVKQMNGTYRLRDADDGLVFEELKREQLGFVPRYRFTVAPRRLEDFADACHHHQTSPDSNFTQKRICTIAIPDGRITLAPDRLVMTRAGRVEETPIPDQAAWASALRRHFGINLEDEKRDD